MAKKQVKRVSTPKRAAAAAAERKKAKAKEPAKKDKEEAKNDASADEPAEKDEAPEEAEVVGEPEPEREPDEKKDRAESPLNILIGEEEENLLLNSGDEHAEEPPRPPDGDGDGDGEPKADDKAPDAADGVEKPDVVVKAEDVEAEAKQEPAEPEKDDGKNKNSNPGRSLWVTNLLPSTRAQELKHLLSRYGKVIGAKVVQSSRHPRTRCYGYVTMESKAAADLCIEKLNNTELKGQIIRVAKVRPEHSLPLKSEPAEPEKKRKSEEKDKKDERKKSVERKERGEREKERAPERAPVRKKAEVLTFDKIREERDRHRQRERERAQREQDKRRREQQRTREIERRQRDEAQRLEREREKLRIERERLDRQRQEILRLERERQKLEREKLEQEKRELRRQQIRLEEARRPVKRPAATSTSTYRRETAGYPDDRKREARETREERHYEEAPPPPRFDVPSREPAQIPREKKEIEKEYKAHLPYSKHTEEYPKREYKREFPPSTDRHSLVGHNGSKYEGSSQFVNREREIREPYRRELGTSVGPPPKISSEVRYNERSNERSPVAYREREERERRPMEHHSKGEMRSRERYPEVSSSKEGRYRVGNSWHGSGPSPTQPFSGAASSRDSWSKPDNWRPVETGSGDRWVSNSSSRLMMSGSSGAPPLYPTGNSSSLNCPPPPGSSGYSMDRFDNYKLGNARKY